jgi:uncharacterized protein (DUF2147 family)
MKYLFILLFYGLSYGQSNIVGQWITVDDNTGEERSIVEIYKQNNKYFGKVVRLLKEEFRTKKCDKCKGADYNKPIEGLVIIKNMVLVDGELKKGEILDPESGKFYTCKIWSDSKDKLNVRGYIAFFYRTQTWKKLK